MFAVVRTGSKQYGITEGSRISIERLEDEPGSDITLKDVLLVESEGETKVGRPVVEGAAVTAQIVRHFRGEKQVIFKKRRRQGYRLKKGHRQELTEIKITGIKH